MPVVTGMLLGVSRFLLGAKNMSKSTRKSAARQTLVPANVLAYEKGFWERRLYCDLHGVVLKWKEAFADFASDALGRNIDPDSFQYYYPQFQKGTNISPAEFDELFLAFAALGVGGYGDLEAYDGV